MKGNGDVESLLRKVPGVVAAVDLPYALKRGLPRAALLNQVDRYVVPSVGALRETASDFQSLPEDFRVNLWASRTPGAYLLSGFVWFVWEGDAPEPEKGEALRGFLEWVLTEGQRTAEAAGYAPLPERFREQVLKSVRGSRQ
jgi:phosphate transport system substrate-binding protein